MRHAAKKQCKIPVENKDTSPQNNQMLEIPLDAIVLDNKVFSTPQKFTWFAIFLIIF